VCLFCVQTKLCCALSTLLFRTCSRAHVLVLRLPVDVAAVSERRQRESDGSTPRAMIFSENNSRVAVLYHTVTVWDVECAANMYCNAGLKNIYYFFKVFKRRIPPLISSEFLSHSLENNYCTNNSDISETHGELTIRAWLRSHMFFKCFPEKG
jgi:hypothetical protein